MAARRVTAKTIFTDDHREFIGRLRAVRRSKEITQTQLSARLDRGQSYISNIERGQRRLDVIEFAAIARALGEEPTALYARLLP
ncbi:helix-turn-helix domain-containing protein [Sphingosinicella sp. LHD-64]|uniref:helix-turn-helix domain-containing protein n=1 Tax=Sphingosinicella sp. LHD-64 TaxID=3072139 RepID=UPI0035BE1848